MNEKFIYNNIIIRKNCKFVISFEGYITSGIDGHLVKKLCDKYFEKINIDRDITEIVGDVRTLFREIEEDKMMISCSKRNEFNYKICFEDKRVISFINYIFDNSVTYYFDYQNNSVNFNILNNNGIEINQTYNNNFINLYTTQLKVLSNLKNISANKINKEILYINELYKLFYGKYPNYNSKNINIKIQNMIYILSEYGVLFLGEYRFNNNNAEKIPMCSYITTLINNVKPYFTIDSNDIYIDRKNKDIIEIIKKTIKESKHKDVPFENAVLYLSIMMYAGKYNLKLGYTIDEAAESLNSSKVAVETGLRLCRSLNKKMFEKN